MLSASILIMVLSSMTYANPTRASISSFLVTTYNVSPATINSMSIVNLTLGSSKYAALYSATSLYLLVNVTSSQYAIVTNQASIADAILNYTINENYNKTNMAMIVADMHNFQESSSHTLADCWQVTGLSSGLTCTSSITCAACSFELTCGGYVPTIGSLVSNFGTQAAFGAVASFSANATILNDSYASFYLAANSINSTNIASRLATMNFAYKNVSVASAGISADPLFTISLSQSQLNECIATTGYPNQPSYCTAYDYCGVLSFNQSALTAVGGLLSEASSLPLTYSQVLTLAYPASENAQMIVEPVITKAKIAQLDIILNTTLRNYTSMVNSTNTLLGHYYNLSLAAQLSIMKSNYGNLTSKYMSENLTQQQANFAIQVEKFNAIYKVINARYENLTAQSTNNTLLLISAQLNASTKDPKLTGYAIEQMQLNNQVSGSISNYNSLKTQLNSISSYASSNYKAQISPAPIALAIYSPFARLLTSALNAPYPASMQFAPTAGAILTIIIGIIIILLVALYHGRLQKSKKILENKRTERNWSIVFIILFVIVLIAAYATMSYLSSVPTTLASFQSAVRGSGSVAIVSNGTDAQLALCAQQTAAKLTQMGKKVVQYSISSGICTSAAGSGTANSCLNSLASSNMPTIMLSISANNEITINSLYGTIMSVQGTSNFMSQCYAAQLA